MLAPPFFHVNNGESLPRVSSGGGSPIVGHQTDPDEEGLFALGYKQEFKRKFTIWSSFSVSFSILGLLPSIAAILNFSLGYVSSYDITHC
jgi:hypothetical protein